MSWAAPSPAMHQPGDQKHVGRIRKTGTSSLVSWVMCEAANAAVRHGPRMEAVCAAARRWHADRHALVIVVVANKTVTITWHMLKNRCLLEF